MGNTYGQTDDGHQCIMPPPYEGGREHNNYSNVMLTVIQIHYCSQVILLPCLAGLHRTVISNLGDNVIMLKCVTWLVDYSATGLFWTLQPRIRCRASPGI